MPRIRQPNEVDVWSPIRAQDFVYSRLHVGVVSSSPNVAEGTMWVTPEGGKKFKTSIPADVSMTLDGAAWRRWIPQVGARVFIAYDIADRARVIGYCMYETSAGGNATDATKEGYKLALARRDKDVASMLMFRTLKAGEWDQKSAGGAYICADNGGQLLMAGRAEVLALDGTHNEIFGETGRYRFESRGSWLKFGDTRSKVLPTDIFDTKLVDGSGVALDVHTLGRARLQIGDIRTGIVPGATPLGAGLVSIPKPSLMVPPGLEMYSLRGYDGALGITTLTNPAAIETSSIVGDSLGNVVVNGLASANLTAPIVRLGSTTAINPIGKGTEIATALSALATAIQAIAAAAPGLSNPLLAGASITAIQTAAQTLSALVSPVVATTLATIGSTSTFVDR